MCKSYCFMCKSYKKSWEKEIKVKYLYNTEKSGWQDNIRDNLFNPEDYSRDIQTKMCMNPECFKYSVKDMYAGKVFKSGTRRKRIISQVQLNDSNMCIYYTPTLFWRIVQKIFYFFK